MAEPVSAKPRSATGHVLLPAFDNHQNRILVPVATTQNLLSWTFGRGTVVRAALRDGAWDKFAGVSGTCADNVMCNLDLAHMACRSLAHRLRCRYAPDLFIAIVLLIFPSRLLQPRERDLISLRLHALHRRDAVLLFSHSQRYS